MIICKAYLVELSQQDLRHKLSNKRLQDNSRKKGLMHCCQNLVDRINFHKLIRKKH